MYVIMYLNINKNPLYMKIKHKNREMITYVTPFHPLQDRYIRITCNNNSNMNNPGINRQIDQEEQ